MRWTDEFWTIKVLSEFLFPDHDSIKLKVRKERPWLVEDGKDCSCCNGMSGSRKDPNMHAVT